MREISLDRLRTLVAIADLGSFAEAARVLHLAPTHGEFAYRRPGVAGWRQAVVAHAWARAAYGDRRNPGGPRAAAVGGCRAGA